MSPRRIRENWLSFKLNIKRGSNNDYSKLVILRLSWLKGKWYWVSIRRNNWSP